MPSWSQALSPWRREICGNAVHIINDVNRQRRSAIADGHCMAGIPREVELGAPGHLLRDHQLAVVFFRQPLQPASNVDRISHGGEIGCLVIAHLTNDGWSGVNSDAHSERLR